MSVSFLQSDLPQDRLTDAQTPDQKRLWFVLAFSAVLAVLVALVPVIGTAAIGPFLLVLVPLVLWSAFRDTERALYVYLAWCWLDGTIRGLVHSAPIAIVARDIVLGIIVVGWGAQRLQNRHPDPIRVPPGTLLVALFAVNCLLQVFNPFAGGIVQSIGGLKLHLSTIPLLFLGYDIIRRPGQVRSLFLFLTLMTLIMGAVSYVQYAQGPSWTWAHFPGSKEVISQNLPKFLQGQTVGVTATFKPPGTTSGGGSSGFYIGMIFPLTFTLPLMAGALRFSRNFKAALVAVLLAFIILIFVNAVRAALVNALGGLVLSGLLVGGRLRARMLAAIALCLVLGGIGFAVSQSVSNGGAADRFASTFANPVDALHKDRHTFFDDAVFIVTHSPLGIGMGRVGGAGGRLGNDANNVGFIGFSEAYLGSIMYETGILGGLLITAIMLSFLGRGFFALQCSTDPDHRLMLTGILALFLIIFANFFVTPVLLGPPGSVLFWLLGGATLRAFNPKARTA